MKNTEKTINFTTHVLLLFWISAKFPSIWYTTWSILSENFFLLIWEEPFSEIGKIERLPTTSRRVAKLRWIDQSKVSRNQHKKLVLTYLVTESWFFPSYIGKILIYIRSYVFNHESKVYKALFCSESSQVDQYTSGDLVSREESNIYIVEMAFRKAVNKLRNLALRNSTVSTSWKVSKYPQNLFTPIIFWKWRWCIIYK